MQTIAALKGNSPRTVQQAGTLSVDFANGIIYNVAVLSIGEATGHGFLIDDLTLDQFLAEAGSSQRSRFGHPEIEETSNADGDAIQVIADDIGKVIGNVSNFRKIAGQIRGDLQLGNYAQSLPGLGDVKTYLLSLAQTNPQNFGMSAVFLFELEPVTGADGMPSGFAARIQSVQAVDVVGRPAANPNGLLSEATAMFDPQPSPANESGWQDPWPALPESDPFPTPEPEDEPWIGDLSDGQFEVLSHLSKTGSIPHPLLDRNGVLAAHLFTLGKCGLAQWKDSTWTATENGLNYFNANPANDKGMDRAKFSARLSTCFVASDNGPRIDMRIKPKNFTGPRAPQFFLSR